MATIKFSAIVSDVRGIVGGNIFSRGANGSYVKSFTKPVNKNTQIQQTTRNNLAVYSAKWRQLTDGDRQAWIDATSQQKYSNRVGTASTYTGFQLFMKTNLILESAAI